MMSTFFRSSASRRTGTSFAGFLAFSISARPAASSSTLMEAPASSSSSSSSNSKNNNNFRHFGGRTFYPQDIYYDAKVKEALTKLRTLKREDVQKVNGGDREKVKILEKSGNENGATLTLIGYKGGTLESQINQDRAIVISPFCVGEVEQQQQANKTQSKGKQNEKSEHRSVSRLIGVFDGHARLGEEVSQYAVTELPKVLASKLDKIEPRDDPEKVTEALVETFIEIDKTAPAEVSGGCTASIILQRGSKVYVANAGDSRSFLVLYRPSSKMVEIIYISREDKPHLPDERERVEKAGGQVYLPPLGTSRVLYTDPDTGLQSGLAMSRSIGDWEVGRLGVIPDPIVEVLDVDQIVENELLRDCQIPEEDEAMNAACFISSDDIHVFAVSATDGLMDFATTEVIAKAVALSLYHSEGSHLFTTLEQLIYLAASGWEKTKQGRYRDDIAISVSEIRRPPRPPP